MVKNLSVINLQSSARKIRVVHCPVKVFLFFFFVTSSIKPAAAAGILMADQQQQQHLLMMHDCP